MAWMDNTYNPHEGVSGAYGHGRTAWYSRDSSTKEETMAEGSDETFTAKGCQMKLRFEDDPASTVLQELVSSWSSSFNLNDINPESIKLNTYSREGGFRCEDYDAELRDAYKMDCDHAEISFKTRAEAPLIEEDWHRIFPKLSGAEHDLYSKNKATGADFEVDDVEYAQRFMKAFRHAVELCGGKGNGF